MPGDRGPCEQSRRLWREGARRPVQDWCDAALRLSDRVAWQAGPWNTLAFPYEAGIFWLWQHPRVESITLQWGTQLGKTVLIPALVAWSACNDPGPALVAGANRDSMRAFEREKLYPLLEDCKETASLLLPAHERAFPVVDLRQMLVFLAWAGSTTALAEKAIRYAFLTELDKWPAEVSREADAEVLALERTKGWPNRKILREGTPTIEGLSRLEANLKAAEVMLEYHVPCPHCGEYQVLSFVDGMRWAKEGETSVPALARETAWYECARCKGAIGDEHRIRMLRRGVWAPPDHHVPDDSVRPVLWGEVGPCRHVGTRLSSLYSPILTWGEMAETFLLYSRDPRKLQDWRNSWEARTWRVTVETPEWRDVAGRLATQTPRSIVPAWARCLTAGIDVHRWKDVYVVFAWGPGPRVQIIECGVVTEGATEQVRLADAVATVLERGFAREGGTEPAPVNLCAVDSAYITDDVYRAIRPYGVMRARAIKGATAGSGARAPWYMSLVQADPATGRRAERVGQALFILDAPYWQATLNSMLARKPEEPGALLLHAAPDEGLLRGLCNVAPVPQKDQRGREVLRYRVIDEEWGDHVHDAACYAIAAADMLGVRLLADKPAGSPPTHERPREYAHGGERKSRWRIGR